MAIKLAASWVLGETRDVHWTPWPTDRMWLLPTWTPPEQTTNEWRRSGGCAAGDGAGVGRVGGER